MPTFRFLFIVLCTSLGTVAGLRAADAPRGPEIVFAGEKLSLAYVEVMPDGSVLNEYIPAGETPETWTVLVALRHHPEAFVDEIVLRWRTYLAGLPTDGMVLKEFQANTRTDQRFTLSLRDPADRFLELNAMRFATDASGRGVSYYQAAVRIYDLKSAAALETALKKQESFEAALPALALAPVRTPLAAAEAASAPPSAP
jgi:hypothetical protein